MNRFTVFAGFAAVFALALGTVSCGTAATDTDTNPAAHDSDTDTTPCEPPPADTAAETVELTLYTWNPARACWELRTVDAPARFWAEYVAEGEGCSSTDQGPIFGWRGCDCVQIRGSCTQWVDEPGTVSCSTNEDREPCCGGEFVPCSPE